jgi:hypothetical protein
MRKQRAATPRFPDYVKSFLHFLENFFASLEHFRPLSATASV